MIANLLRLRRHELGCPKETEMHSISVQELEERFDAVMAKVEAGRVVIITRDDVDVVRMQPVIPSPEDAAWPAP